MFKIIAITGESGSGKDTVLKHLLKAAPDKFQEIIPYTTRPKRDYEIDKKDYYFISSEQFYELLEDRGMIEVTVFNDWCYGTCVDQLSEDKINIGVYNPNSVDILSSIPNIELQIFRIKTVDKERIIHTLNREEEPNIEEVFRRYVADKKDFQEFEYYFGDRMIIVYNDFHPETLDTICEKILGEVN